MIRIGFSRDIHRIEENGRPFMIGGIEVPSIYGPVSHSDGDCLLHAIAEAFLGSLSLGDLGKLFPDTSKETENMDSKIILKECYKLVLAKGYKLVNLDACVILDKPHLQKYLPEIRASIAKILDTDIENVSIKPQTNENIGEIRNIECMCSLLISND
jgi:2-C-methyl-D-erythritol 2,4-cyclodiphosphate synthase